MSINVQEVPAVVAKSVLEASGLIQRNYQDLGLKDYSLCVDWDRLRAAGSQCVKVFLIRKHGAVVGYACFLVSEHLHYASCKVARCDVIFIDPKERGCGGDALSQMEAVLKEAGVDEVAIASRVTGKIDSFLVGNGYEPQETVFFKTIGG